MTDMYAHVSVRILEKEYQVSCPANERTELLDSAEMLNAKMREIRDSGKVVGLDRIAVMAALNMANELIRSKAKDEVLETSFGPRLKLLSDRVEGALGGSQQLAGQALLLLELGHGPRHHCTRRRALLQHDARGGNLELGTRWVRLLPGHLHVCSASHGNRDYR